MPALLIPVITSALSATALSSTAIAATAFISAHVIVAGAALGLQALLTPDNNQKVASQQYQSRQALPTLLYGYGTTKLGGTKFEFDNGGGIYLDGVVHSAGPVNRVVNWLLNDTKVTGLVDTSPMGGQISGPNAAKPWGGNIMLHTQKGVGNTASGYLTSNLPNRWTQDHRLQGLFITTMACIPATEKTFQKIYPNGPPAVYVIAEMAPVYDPRDASQNWDDPSTWKYSENVALALLHYLTAIRGIDSVTGQPVPYGFGFAHSRIDLPSFIAYANVCDQAVPLKAGGFEKRYRIGGTFDMGQEERRTVLNRILATGDGEIYQGPGGRIAVRGGEWTAPTVTIGEKHILGYEFSGGADKLAAFNRLKISFSDPKNDYQVIEGDAWDDLASQAASPNGTITQDLSLPMVNSHPQSRRLAKIATAKANPVHKLTITTDIYGLLALGERTIRVVLPELGIDDTFLVTSFSEGTDGLCTIGISSLGAEAYAWTPGAEEGTPPAIADSVRQPVVVPDVQNPVLSIERYSTGGSVSGLGVRASATAPSNPIYELHGRIRQVGTTTWFDMTDAGEPWSLIYRPVSDGINFEVQLAYWAPFGGTQGPWVPAGTITTVADAAAPAAPTYTSAALTGTAARHTFRQSPSLNARTIELLRADGFGKVAADAAVVFSEALSPNQSDAYDDVFEFGYRQTWMRAKNGSGVASPVDGPKVMTKFDQAGNLTTAPNDIGNASWIKSNLTAPSPVSGGPTGPDGALATLVSETAASGSKSILWHATGLTSGKRFRAIYGIKPNGRTRGRLDLFDPANTGTYTRVVFNLGTGTLGAVATAGAAFTGATATLVKVSADYWLLVLTSTAALTAIDTRFYFYDDAGAASYTGDTSKGMLLWACTFAAVN